MTDFGYLKEDKPTKKLPKHRMNLIKYFQHREIDYTGHKKVKYGQHNKIYMLIFTCLSIRIVHIELVKDIEHSHLYSGFNQVYQYI